MWFRVFARSPKPEKVEAPQKPRRKPKMRSLTGEDHANWYEVTRSVTPLEGRSAPPEPTPAPAADRMPVTAPAVALSKAPAALPPLVRMEKRSLRQVSRGARDIEARIDLHGMRQVEAHAALHSFLHRQHHAGARLVLVITGKGARSPEMVDLSAQERGVLRRLVPHWLSDPAMRRLVLGFESAAQHHGGEGALYVRLRRRES